MTVETDISQLINGAAHIFGTSAAKIKSKDRHQEYVLPRHAGCLVAKLVRGHTHSAIARVMSVDHTSIIYAIDNAGGRLSDTPLYRERVERLRSIAEEIQEKAPQPIPAPSYEAAGIGRLTVRLRELAKYEPARFEAIKTQILQ